MPRAIRQPLGVKDTNRVKVHLPESIEKHKPSPSTPTRKTDIINDLFSKNFTVRRGTCPNNQMEVNKQIKKKKRKQTSLSPSISSVVPPPLSRKKQHINDSYATPPPLCTSSSTLSTLNYLLVWDTPISILNDDCLLEIFLHCADTKTLSALAAVCRRWRSLILAPYIWRKLYFHWIPFVQQMSALSHHPSIPKQLLYVRSLSMENEIDNRKMAIRLPKIYPFQNLREVHLRNMYLDDITELAMWMDSIEVLTCENIMTRGSQSELILSVFTKLQRLRVLVLQFMQMCEHSSSSLMMTGTRKMLPASLEVLTLNNLYDCEEYMIRPIIAENIRSNQRPEVLLQRWSMMEQSLVMKYQTFSRLRNLKSLTLGRCNAFTARVWRECLMPCTTQLEYLSLSGCSGRANHEGWKARSLYPGHTPILDITDDMEAAIGEFFGSLRRIRVLKLSDFCCSGGMATGFLKLASKKPIVISANHVVPPFQNLEAMVGCFIAHAEIRFLR
ncbi:uncharacterized protein BYT42DRAFT_580417 [Radiomyces spectabilis]|uniref:uncharacterized protein n=1 Tax=Radiomyces spectabilis TaxID=64574 RepID=UPI00221F34B3|nr:uncharacterized protein BYT42DRAFT_580417 [Radiomyces spectabilis]KAI8371483.1 hypothetical protein BYT42DRAFT_580417 [Radiomyces spectabilis]